MWTELCLQTGVASPLNFSYLSHSIQIQDHFLETSNPSEIVHRLQRLLDLKRDWFPNGKPKERISNLETSPPAWCVFCLFLGVLLGLQHGLPPPVYFTLSLVIVSIAGLKPSPPGLMLRPCRWFTSPQVEHPLRQRSVSGKSPSSARKNTHNLKVESYFYLVGMFGTPSLEDSISVALRKLFQGGMRKSGYIQVCNKGSRPKIRVAS